VLDRLDHVILAVRGLDAAAAAYARLLGRGVSWRGEHPGAGTANALFRLDNTYLELLTATGDGPVGRALAAWLDLHGEGLLGLAFGTADADACRGWLSAQGLEPEPVERGLGRDLESGAFRRWRRVPLPLARTRGVLLFAVEHTSPAELLPPAPLAGGGASAVQALDHVVVRSSDPEAARRLYGEALGLRLALDRSFEAWGLRLIFFRVGGATVEIAAALGRDAAEPDPERDRLFGLSWRVGDADAARLRLVEAGLDVSEVRPGRRPGTRVASVRSGTCGVPTLILAPAPAE
jgi:catechol 2,3-dioxygenase-like lactoylglutathione lyase family enzyme